MIQEHIDLLIRTSSGTTRTYQTMLDLHVRDVIGHIPVDKLDYRHMNHWVKSMIAKGRPPKTIHNVHGLISAAMNTAEMFQYIPRNPCRGVQLPSLDRAEDKADVHAEFSMIMEGMGERYKAFTNFLVMTGPRFGEATALTVGDVGAGDWAEQGAPYARSPAQACVLADPRRCLVVYHFTATRPRYNSDD